MFQVEKGFRLDQRFNTFFTDSVLEQIQTFQVGKLRLVGNGNGACIGYFIVAQIQSGEM